MTLTEEREEAVEANHEYILRIGMAGLTDKDPVPQDLHNFAHDTAQAHVERIRDQKRLDRVARLRGIANNL